uniref:HAD-superfamily hydrolase, subfamily IIB n=1 Tax=uncultured Nocardioidaceae bacterium TaxID=253824 RepID=A0A6J4MEZ2_9ACTN|nr:MAG: HAD-superfamily hydrolase, subfamily IIB [uncultured Nocardioidaceae bacterium]
MSFAPKMLALDVDGTLVDFEDQMTGRVRDTVRTARDAGLHVVISTGRSTPGVMDAAHKLGFEEGLAVASNGAVTFSYSPVELLSTVTFDARETVKLVLEHVPDAAVAVEEVGRGYRINKAFPAGEISGEMIVQSVEELVAEPVTRVIIRSPGQSAEEFTELAERLGLHGISYFVGYTAWLDLAPEGVSKASGLESICARLGLEAGDVLAIGDGLNDLEMLRWAGRGVAMGGSPPQVIEAADDVTGSVHEDGLADEIERWL